MYSFYSVFKQHSDNVLHLLIMLIVCNKTILFLISVYACGLHGIQCTIKENISASKALSHPLIELDKRDESLHILYNAYIVYVILQLLN